MTESRPRVAGLVRDLMTASRVEAAVSAAGGSWARVEHPARLPAPEALDLLVVDWGDRGAGWAAELSAWRLRGGSGERPTVVLFGPHTDLEAHASARDAGLGPMRARSAFFASLPRMLETPART